MILAFVKKSSDSQEANEIDGLHTTGVDGALPLRVLTASWPQKGVKCIVPAPGRAGLR